MPRDGPTWSRGARVTQPPRQPADKRVIVTYERRPTEHDPAPLAGDGPAIDTSAPEATGRASPRARGWDSPASVALALSGASADETAHVVAGTPPVRSYAIEPSAPAPAGGRTVARSPAPATAAPSPPASASTTSDLQEAAQRVVDLAGLASMSISGGRMMDAPLARLRAALGDLAAALHLHAGALPRADAHAIESARTAVHGVVAALSLRRGGPSLEESELQTRLRELDVTAQRGIARAAVLESPVAMVEQVGANLDKLQAMRELAAGLAGKLPAVRTDELDAAIARTSAWAEQAKASPAAATRLTRAIIDQEHVLLIATAELQDVLRRPVTDSTGAVVAAYLHAIARSTERQRVTDELLEHARGLRQRQPLDRAHDALDAGSAHVANLGGLDPEDGARARSEHRELAARTNRLERRIGQGEPLARGEVDDVVLATREYELLQRLDVLRLQARQLHAAIDKVRHELTPEILKVTTKLDELEGTATTFQRRYRAEVGDWETANFDARPGEVRAHRRKVLHYIEAQLVATLEQNQYLPALDAANDLIENLQTKRFYRDLTLSIALTVAGNFAAAAVRGAAEGAVLARTGAVAEGGALSLTAGASAARVGYAAGVATDGLWNAVTQKYLQGDESGLTTLFITNILTAAAIDRVMAMGRTADDLAAAHARHAGELPAGAAHLPGSADFSPTHIPGFDPSKPVTSAGRLSSRVAGWRALPGARGVAARGGAWVFRKGTWVLREGVQLSGEMVIAAGVSYAAHRAFEARATSVDDQTITQWITQGIAMAIGRHLSAQVGAIRTRLATVEGYSHAKAAELIGRTEALASASEKLALGEGTDQVDALAKEFAEVWRAERELLQQALVAQRDFGDGPLSARQLEALLRNNDRAGREHLRLLDGTAGSGGSADSPDRGAPTSSTAPPAEPAPATPPPAATPAAAPKEAPHDEPGDRSPAPTDVPAPAGHTATDGDVPAHDQSKLEVRRLAAILGETELDALLAHVKVPRRLLTMVDHVGEDTFAKMVRQWQSKGQFDKMNLFLERMAGGAGRELAEMAPLGTKSVIIDSNTAIALMMDADPTLRPAMHAGHIARVKYVKSLPAGTELRVANVTVGEIEGGKLAMRGIPLDIVRESPPYRSMLGKLDSLNVGGGKGFADRAIVADAFFASAEPGTIPRFVTGDEAVFKKLARAAGIDPAKLGGKTLPELYPAGFDVTIDGRTLKVIPLGN